jgi:F0F1-type ATP synthase assembly protein I
MMTETKTPSTQRKTRRLNNFRVTSLGWELVFPIFVGVFAGYIIDKSVSGPSYFTIILAVIGIIAGYINLVRYIELDYLRTKAANLRKEKEKESVT